MSNGRIVLHIAGPDHPGVVSELAKILAEEKAALIDIGQSVLHGYLVLSAIVEIPATSLALRRILFAVAEQGLRMEAMPLATPSSGKPLEPAPPSFCITLLGDLRCGSAFAGLSEFLAERRMNIRGIRTISDDFEGVELIADLPQDEDASDARLSQLRGEILSLAGSLSVDVAVQRDDLFRRNKRLVCMDVDSTFVQAEVINELAALVGCEAEVAEITERAMRGELDFSQALDERVKLLAGLPLEKAKSVIDQVELTSGAGEFVRTLKSLGYRVGLVSGGFDFFVDELKARFGLDFAFANELEVIDGRLTGKVQGTVLDASRKAQLLKDMAKVYKCRLQQTIAIGDGANDIQMLQTAGLGIAYHGKPRLQEVADMSLNHHSSMEKLLLLMGYHASDLKMLRHGDRLV